MKKGLSIGFKCIFSLQAWSTNIVLGFVMNKAVGLIKIVFVINWFILSANKTFWDYGPPISFGSRRLKFLPVGCGSFIISRSSLLYLSYWAIQMFDGFCWFRPQSSSRAYTFTTLNTLTSKLKSDWDPIYNVIVQSYQVLNSVYKPHLTILLSLKKFRRLILIFP